jgi:hypothetical protein
MKGRNTENLKIITTSEPNNGTAPQCKLTIHTKTEGKQRNNSKKNKIKRYKKTNRSEPATYNKDG